ncbi:MAG: formylglycine-generating enzyme family protein [Deltaproteobacteria bacterium]|jgi:formylglycine-generating enzyme required for sulfatase activity|nr:formylglycine-generating enzyme family protein [Deltaproteobacteria bacterium]
MRKGKFVITSLCLALLFPGMEGMPSAAELTPYTNSIGMEFVLIPAGSFMMGTDKNVEDAADNETPQHRVYISKPFYLGKHEVTQAQWETIMGDNPSRFQGRSNPVEQVSWDDAQEFVRRLNQREGHARFRLPTEAEWEYAARAETTTAYSFGDGTDNLGRYAWYGDNSSGKPHPVGQKEPNAWGLYDIHGNVWEWVQDRFGERYYAISPASDPGGPSDGPPLHVFRGGSWHNPAKFCRSADRNYYTPYFRSELLGFRLALSPE